MTTSIDHQAVKAFLETCDHTNFTITAFGNGWDGGISPSITVKTSLYGKRPETIIHPTYQGRMIEGQQHLFSSALTAAKAGDYLRAFETLLVSSPMRFYRVILAPLRDVSTLVDGQRVADRPNPLAETLAPLVWESEEE